MFVCQLGIQSFANAPVTLQKHCKLVAAPLRKSLINDEVEFREP